MEGKDGETSSHVASHFRGCSQPQHLCVQIANVIRTARNGLCQQRCVVQIERRIQPVLMRPVFVVPTSAFAFGMHYLTFVQPVNVL